MESKRRNRRLTATSSSRAKSTSEGEGAAGVVQGIQGPWVFGALLSIQWSYAGRGDKNVNAMLLQPFVNYNLSGGWYLTSPPVMAANWKADSGNRWTVPLGGSIGKLFKVGKLPLILNCRYWATSKGRGLRRTGH